MPVQESMNAGQEPFYLSINNRLRRCLCRLTCWGLDSWGYDPRGWRATTSFGLPTRASLEVTISTSRAIYFSAILSSIALPN